MGSTPLRNIIFEVILADLEWADAIITRPLTRYGLPVAQVKHFIYTTEPLRATR